MYLPAIDRWPMAEDSDGRDFAVMMSRSLALVGLCPFRFKFKRWLIVQRVECGRESSLRFQTYLFSERTKIVGD